MLAITGLCGFLLHCSQPGTKADAGNRPGYVGTAACAGCHQTIHREYKATAHFNTSAPVHAATFRADWSVKENTYFFPNGDRVHCEYTNNGFYQVAHTGSDSLIQSADFVIGFGKNAQSFGHWSGNIPVQLPLTFFSARKAWLNSPGYPDKVFLNRVITSRCFECHTSYAEVTGEHRTAETFNTRSVVYGIDCEKCHGPGAAHIKWAGEMNRDTTSSNKYIVSPRQLSRQQQIDMCAVCHSGSMTGLQPAFSFKPGDKLADFYAYNIVAPDIESLDVHGNQYGLLSLSACFIQSDMTCMSCHDVHKKEIFEPKLFSRRCISCHTESKVFCSIKGIDKKALLDNCIDCHMPLKDSRAIVFKEPLTGKELPASMRAHIIKIYPEETKKVIAFINR